MIHKASRPKALSGNTQESTKRDLRAFPIFTGDTGTSAMVMALLMSHNEGQMFRLLA